MHVPDLRQLVGLRLGRGGLLPHPARQRREPRGALRGGRVGPRHGGPRTEAAAQDQAEAAPEVRGRGQWACLMVV